jgi:hypothetical protein
MIYIDTNIRQRPGKDWGLNLVFSEEMAKMQKMRTLRQFEEYQLKLREKVMELIWPEGD